jgi:uncharacterized protein involved in response to NO
VSESSGAAGPPLSTSLGRSDRGGPGQTPERALAAPRAPPHANPFDVSRPYAAVMSLALGLALLPGLGIGLLLVLIAGLRVPLAVAWPQLAQAHGQVQALGFTLLFIVAVGLQLFPRFLGTPPRNAPRAVWCAGGIALALGARLAGQPLEPGLARSMLLTVAAVGLPVGAIGVGSAFHGLTRGRASSATGAEAWRRFAALGGVALGCALALSVWAGVDLALGELVVSQGLDEALIHLEVAGFATCLVFGVSSRVFGRFLLLKTRPEFERRIPLLAVAWGAGLLLVTLGWLLQPTWASWVRWAGALVELGVLGTWVWLIGLYAPPVRASGTPYVTNPTRRWIRLAFAFLVLGLALDVGLFGREALYGLAPAATELSAARHALAQGFLLPLMVAMAARLLPIFSADVLRHRLRLEITVDLLLLGALVRVVAEVTGGYGPLAGPLVAVGGALGVAGFAIFAFGLGLSLRRLPGLRT